MKPKISALIILATAFTALGQSLLTSPIESPAQRAARETVQAVQAAKSAEIGILRDGVSRLWDSSDPQGALDVLGAHAAEVVLLYRSLVDYLNQILSSAGDSAGLTEVAAIAAKVPSLTLHQDGTVTIDPKPSPTPHPRIP